MSETPGRLVLIAEDDLDVLHLLCSALDGAGFHTVAASEAHEAEALLGRADIGLLVTDVGLGDASGIALAVRARELRPALPVLFVSGQPDLDHGLGGAVEVLGKPFSLTSLINGAQRLAGGPTDPPGPPEAAARPPSGGTSPATRGAAAPAAGARPAPDLDPAPDLVARLLDARDEELAAIAGHLHDDHLQQLSAVTLRLGLLRVRGLVSPEVDAELAELEQVLLCAADGIRTQVLDLSPSWLDEATVGSSVEALAARHPGLELQVPADGDGAHELGLGRRGHRILQALLGELATWSLEPPVEVEAVAEGDGAVVRVTATGSPPVDERPLLRAEELAALSGCAVRTVDLGVQGDRVRRCWELRLA